jgi:hypothetical protein
LTQNQSSLTVGYVLLAAITITATVLVLLQLGRSPICECGFVKLWHGETMSSENSQHISDWYSPSHFIHGILFYGALAWIFGNLSIGVRFNIAVLIEAVWEIFENTEFIINRYRETTIALDYFGDSVLNSASDIMFMILGFIAAWRLPVWLIVALAIGFELLTAVVIRDNLTLNVIMLLHPFEAIKTWQMG